MTQTAAADTLQPLGVYRHRRSGSLLMGLSVADSVGDVRVMNPNGTLGEIAERLVHRDYELMEPRPTVDNYRVVLPASARGASVLRAVCLFQLDMGRFRFRELRIAKLAELTGLTHLQVTRTCNALAAKHLVVFSGRECCGSVSILPTISGAVASGLAGLPYDISMETSS